MEFMKDFYRVAGEQSDALFERIYSLFGLCDCDNSGKIIEY